MDREPAETFLRLLAEAELRHAAAMPAARMPGLRHPAGLALAAQALTAVGAVDSGVAMEIQADSGLAVAARQTPTRDTGPGRIRSAPKRTSWRIVPVGQVIKTPDSGLRGELILMAYAQSAGGGRFLVADWPSGPFTATAADDRGASYQVRWRGEMAPRELELHPGPAHQIRWLDLTAAAGEPAIRIDLTRQPPVPDITVTPQAHSPGELLLDVIAARILTAAALLAQDNPGRPAAASTLPRALSDGLGHVVAALYAADALPPGSPVPGQLAGLCATLGITGHGITAPPAAGLPQHWHSMLAPGRPAQTPAAPRIWAMTAAELSGLDGATIAIAGLHHGERGTIMHLLATGVTLEDDWPYARGVRPLPVLWIRDNDSHWHTTRLDGLSPWGDHGTNPWTDTRMVTLWLRIIPPLDPGTAWIEISATGRSAHARTTLALSPQ
jgi:hypothetical protein